MSVAARKAHSIPETVAITGISRSKLYLEIKAGNLSPSSSASTSLSGPKPSTNGSPPMSTEPFPSQRKGGPGRPPPFSKPKHQPAPAGIRQEKTTCL